MLVLLFSGCINKQVLATPCEQWMESAVKAVESVPPAQRFETALQQVSKACKEAIAESLRNAAVNSLKHKDFTKRRKILMAASAPYFPDACQDTPVSHPAKRLLHICLGSDYKGGTYTSVLDNVDAAAYLFGKALEKNFNDAGIDADDQKKFLLNYFLGAALAYESNSQG
jgi:hypothetical protein